MKRAPKEKVRTRYPAARERSAASFAALRRRARSRRWLTVQGSP